jgi:serine/threonine-protein kinase
MALALLALLGFLAISGLLAGEKREVPRVVGKQLIQARAQLERAGFEVRTERVTSQQDFDEVVDQDPDAGEEAEEGSTITLEVSNGPGNVLVPPVENLPREQAIRELEKVGLKVSWEERPSDEVREGFAIETVPEEGQAVEKGSRVRLFVSSGPEQVAVPDVVGLSRDSAQGTLESEGLKVSVKEEPSDEPEDQVISQDPAAGEEVDEGTRVTITISTGPEQVNVPDVTGLSAAEARRELRDAGLKVVERESPVLEETQDGVVVDQAPDAAVEVDEGTAVVIFVGRFQPTDTLAPEEPAVP